MTVLVVDDQSGFRHLHARILRGAGMVVLEADTGRAALALARTARPDVIVTDLEMPELNGIELCRALRNDAACKDLFIVMVSGSAATQGDEAVAAGCDAVLEKPCPPALLLTTIRTLLVRVRGPH